ncbi:MAG: helix-turn-helix domain-containing protein [Rhodospirillaceae bacterium]
MTYQSSSALPASESNDSGSTTADPLDVYVGNRIRIRRTLLGMSQNQLAQSLGISFQQVQKYERGTNRISSSRLFDIGLRLGVDISYFFADLPDSIRAERRPMAHVAENSSAETTRGQTPADPFNRTETLELVQCFWRLPNDKARQTTLDMLKAYTSS